MRRYSKCLADQKNKLLAANSFSDRWAQGQQLLIDSASEAVASPLQALAKGGKVFDVVKNTVGNFMHALAGDVMGSSDGEKIFERSVSSSSSNRTDLEEYNRGKVAFLYPPKGKRKDKVKKSKGGGKPRLAVEDDFGVGLRNLGSAADLLLLPPERPRRANSSGAILNQSSASAFSTSPNKKGGGRGSKTGSSSTSRKGGSLGALPRLRVAELRFPQRSFLQEAAVEALGKWGW